MKRKIIIIGSALFLIVIGFIYLPIPGLEIPKSHLSETGDDYFDRIKAGQNLDRPFPEMPLRSDNPITTEKIELGKLLYFDPILSGDNDVSCAHCHHPDLGFSDNRAFSMGKNGKGIGRDRHGGKSTGRGSPTIWNSAYNHLQFWDGRADDLEHQAEGPIQDQNEMDQKPDQLVAELKSISDYVDLFDQTFGGENGSAITFQNVTYAIATFERTILSQNSRFDLYAKGDRTALTPAEQRGLNIFRSMKTRCFECHNFPTFANRDFKVVGTPDLPDRDADLGRGGLEDQGENYNRAFKVPTLRNIAITAPYMHNGIFQTLDEVIDFYANGGGRGLGIEIPNLDDKIRKFKITENEKSDLIAFFHALTDESQKPKIPRSVPSGLPIVSELENQSPELTAFKKSSKPKTDPEIEKIDHVITVRSGQSIQSAINIATAGDTIRVMPGIYHESISVDISDISIVGVIENDERPILDGKGELADGMVGTASNLTISGFDVRNYTANGLMINGGVNVTFREIRCDNTGLYGIYSVECVGVFIDRCEVTKVRDAGIYVGQSKSIVVENCVVHGNVTGIEIENSVDAIVKNNKVYDNAGGILVFLLPNNPSKVSRNCVVTQNLIYENNHENFADPNAIVSQVPSGTGVLIMAADEVEVWKNEIRDNNSVGVAVVELSKSDQNKPIDVDPISDNCYVHNNILKNNGSDPDQSILDQGLSGADLLWDLSGHDNNWNNRNAKSIPPILPSRSFPNFLRRANWRLWRILKGI